MKTNNLKKRYRTINLVSNVFSIIAFLALYYSIFNNISLLKTYIIVFFIIFAGMLYRSTRLKDLMVEAKAAAILNSEFEHTVEINLDKYEKIISDDKTFYLLKEAKQLMYIAKIHSLDEINAYLNPFVSLCHQELKTFKKTRSVGMMFMVDENVEDAAQLIKNNPISQLPMRMRYLKKAYMFLSAYDESSHKFYWLDHIDEMVFSVKEPLYHLIETIQKLYK